MASLLKIFRINPFRNQLSPIIRNLSAQNTKIPQAPLINFINPWITKKENAFKLPVKNNNHINLPSGMFYIPKVDKINDDVEAPSNTNSDITIQAARLIVIRRRKMRRHKLKKLRKRMRFEWAKRRQKRELRKEKEFQAVLLKKCEKAESFSAEDYVQSRIDKMNELIVPRFWKGKRLPEFIIREKFGLPPKK